MNNDIQVMRQVLSIPEHQANEGNREMPDLNLTLIYRLSALLLVVSLVIPWLFIGGTKGVNFVSTYFELADQREIYEEVRADKLKALDSLEDRGVNVEQFNRQPLPIGTEQEIATAIRSEKEQIRVLQARIAESKRQETRLVEQYKAVYQQLQKLKQSGADNGYAERQMEILEENFPSRVLERAKKEILEEKNGPAQ